MEHTLREIYTEIEETVNKKVLMYSQYWDACKLQISAALSDAFGVDCSGLFNDLRCSEMVVESIMRDRRLSSINPYFPRENGGCKIRLSP